MKKILVFCLLFCAGCEFDNKKHFEGSVEVQNVDGETKSLSINFPSDTTISNKDEAERLVQVLESFIEMIQTAKERAFQENHK